MDSASTRKEEFYTSLASIFFLCLFLANKLWMREIYISNLLSLSLYLYKINET